MKTLFVQISYNGICEINAAKALNRFYVNDNDKRKVIYEQFG